MNEITCVKLDQKHQKNLNKSFQSKLNINKFQTYFPILSLYFDFHNNGYSHKCFTLQSKYIVHKLVSKIETEQKLKDGYIKFIFNCQLKNTVDKLDNPISDSKIFIKLSPILDVIPYIMNEYNTNHPNSLPNIFSYLTNKKINSYNNSAYIDSFFSFLGNKLCELGKCPTFPIYHGTFSGMAERFDFDITEEYNSIKNSDWFDTYHQKLFDIIKYENDYFSGSDDSDDDDDANHDETNTLELNNNNLEELLKDFEENKSVSSNNEDNLDSDSNSNSDINSISSFGSISNDSGMDLKFLKFVRLKNFPVQISCMELFDKTLDELIDDKKYTITDLEWKSILFQICFGLSVAQKHFNFVHNDLHSSNIMFKETELSYLYFFIQNKYYKIPTFGKITKIIDFGRATFNVNNHLFFSDVFKKHGDAEGQYNYPYHNNVTKNKVKTNPSFDLARLSTTIIEHFEEDTEIFNLLKLWATDKYGNCLIYHSDNFDLYKKIAKNVISANPKAQLKKKLFQTFTVSKKDIPKGNYIYYY